MINVQCKGLLKCFAFFRLKGNRKQARQNDERNTTGKGQKTNDEEQKQIKKHNEKSFDVFAEYGQAIR